MEDFGNVVYLVNYGVTGEGRNDLSEVHIFVAKDYLVTDQEGSLPRAGHRSGSGWASLAACPPGLAGRCG